MKTGTTNSLINEANNLREKLNMYFKFLLTSSALFIIGLISDYLFVSGNPS